jgi:hypothetical protein
MISAEILTGTLTVLNLIPLALLILIHLKLARESIRPIFTLLIIFGMLWGNSILLSRYDGWENGTRLTILETVFAAGIVLALIFLAFFIRFTGNQALFRKPVFWFFSANTTGIVVCSFLGVIVTSFDMNAGLLKLHYGILYPWFIASFLAMQVYGIIIAIKTYRKSDDDLLKFQLRTILIYAGITFVLVNVTNIVLPNLMQSSQSAIAGPYFAFIFLAGVFRIVFSGARLFAQAALKRLLKTTPFNVQRNIFAVREFLLALKTAVVSGEASSMRRIEFAGAGGEKIALTLAKNAPAEALLFDGSRGENSVVPQKWLKGFQDTLRVLEEDNRLLTLSLIKAEGTLQQQWVSDTLQKLPARDAAIFADTLEIADYLPQVAKNIADNREAFGVEICTLSRVMYKQMAQVEDLARGNQLIVVEGEPGTGKATMARAINFFRLKDQRLLEIHCQNGNIDALAKDIAAVAAEAKKAKKKTGVLIRGMDILPLEMVSIFTPLFDLDPEKTWLYITSAPDYLRNLEGLSDTLFHRLNQVRIQLPPLRRRGDDVNHLIFWYAALYAKKMKIPFTHVSAAFLADARRLSWQGNIVELIHTVQREILNNKPPVLKTFHMNDPHALAAPGQVLTPLERAERKVIVDHLKKNNYNKNRTRIELDITVNTLNAKIIKYQIELPD